MPEQQGLDVDDSTLILLGFWQALIGSMLTRHTLLLLAAGAAMATIAAPAHAITQTQTVGPVSFTTTGVASSTPSLSFAGFNTSLGTLTSVALTNSTGGNLAGSFGGTLTTGAFAAGTYTYTAKALTQFTFSNGQTSQGSALSSATLTPATTTFPTFGSVSAAGSGNFSVSTTSILVNNNTLASYFAATPTINSITTLWQTAFTGGPDGAIGANALTASSNAVYLTYTYTNPDAVPGPLPILGAGAAFGFSRKLRQRIRSSAS